MIDIHHHLIYGVDDGSRDLEMSKNMIRRAVQEGVDTVVCTSHCTPGHRPFPIDVYLRHLDNLRAYIQEENLNLTLLTGCEVLYTEDTPKLARQGKVPLLASSPWLLVEFLPDTSWSRIEQAAREVGNAGFGMVAAHVERYHCLHEDMERLETLQDYGVLCQMNASTVISSHGLFGDRFAKRALREGLIDLIGSDAHNLQNRACRMHEAYEVLRKDYGKETAIRLTNQTAARICYPDER